MAKIKLDKNNARNHSDRNKDLVNKSLNELGAGRSVLLDASDTLIAGNATYEQAEKLGIPVRIIETDGTELIAVKRTDLQYDDPRRKALAIVDNSANDLSEFKEEIWEMEEFKEIDLVEWGVGLPGETDEDEESETELEAEEDDYEIPDVVHTDIVKGDLFEFAKGELKHRLLCGDSTDSDAVAKLMDGRKADLLLTDPPYGVKMDKGFGGFRGFGGFGKPIASKQYTDDWDSERPSSASFTLHLSTCNRAIIFGGNFFADVLPQSKHWLVWDKLNTMPTFGDCELAWTNIERKSVKKYTIQYNGLIGKEKERFHPTQKPVKLFGAIIPDYTQENELLVDYYLGSGTTMVAAHQLDRNCYGMELAENYCQITVDRMLKLDNEIKLFRNGEDVTNKYRERLQALEPEK
jgi:DNA modification methylase